MNWVHKGRMEALKQSFWGHGIVVSAVMSAWQSKCGLSIILRRARTGKRLATSRFPICSNSSIGDKAERITQDFPCHESSWDTKLKKRQRRPAMATQMHRASVFTRTIRNNATNPSRGWEIIEKGQKKNKIQVEKWFCKRYLPKMPFTGKLMEKKASDDS